MRSSFAAKTPVVLCFLTLASAALSPASALAQSAKHPADLSGNETTEPESDDAADVDSVPDDTYDAEPSATPSRPEVAPAKSTPAKSAPPKTALPKSSPPKTTSPKSTPPPKPRTPPRKKGSKATRKPGSDPGQPNPAARMSVTGGLPVDDGGLVEPPELAALRELDRALFPELAPGDSPWVLDRPIEPTAPVRISNGLPPSTVLAPIHKPEPVAELEWLERLSTPDIPVRWDSRVVRYLDYYKNTPRGRSMITLWIKKSGRYEAKIRTALRQHKLPEDIVWLALMESGFNADIRSPAGAVGLWQFTEKAAEAYGLRVDRWVDERLDPERSTEAAIRYLSDLHTRFGRWELAFAAYNMGYGGLLSSIRKYNTNDYWELSRYEAGVPYETALYVPKIVAMAVVARNRSTFGVDKVQVETPMVFDEVAVGAGITLEAIAKAADIEEKEIAALNPHLLGDRTPPALSSDDRTSWLLKVPSGRGDEIAGALPRETPLDRSLDRVVVRWGEAIDDIADDRGVTAAKVRQLSGLSARELVRPGDVLLVPRRNRAKVAGKVEAKAVVVPAEHQSYPDRKRVFYKVAWGDTATDIAEALGVSLEELSRWNALDPSAKLQSDMVLQAFVPSSSPLSRVRLLPEDQVRLLVQGSEAFFAYFEEQKGRRRIEIVARAGDTWKKIAKRYGISLGMLERINHKSRTSELSDGDRVVVYVERDRAPDDVVAGVDSEAEGDRGQSPTETAASVR